MAPHLKILHCLRAPVGGLFRHVLDLAGAQAARGHEVGLLADALSGDSLTEGRLAEIAPRMALGVTRIPMSRYPGPGDLSAAMKTKDLALKLGAGILHGHGAKGGAYARLARRTLTGTGQQIACFYTPHGGTLNFRPGSIEGRVYLGLEKVLARFTDGLIFESAYASRVYNERVGQTGVPVRVIPNGLHPQDFAIATPDAGAADFLFIGELRDIKGVDVLLDSLAQLNKARKVTACIVGAGPWSDQLKAQAAALGLAHLTEFTGAMPARQVFPRGRCLVVPSRTESFPYIVLEGAAAGLPLIATDVGGIPEIVAGTDTALLPSDDAMALANAMQGFLEMPGLHQERAARLRANVAQRFTVDAMSDAVLDFYAASTIR